MNTRAITTALVVAGLSACQSKPEASKMEKPAEAPPAAPAAPAAKVEITEPANGAALASLPSVAYKLASNTNFEGAPAEGLPAGAIIRPPQEIERSVPAISKECKIRLFTFGDVSCLDSRMKTPGPSSYEWLNEWPPRLFSAAVVAKRVRNCPVLDTRLRFAGLPPTMACCDAEKATPMPVRGPLRMPATIPAAKLPSFSRFAGSD